MKIVGQQIRLAGSDLSNHLACRHLTTLDLQLARGERAEPEREPHIPDPEALVKGDVRHAEGAPAGRSADRRATAGSGIRAGPCSTGAGGWRVS